MGGKHVFVMLCSLAVLTTAAELKDSVTALCTFYNAQPAAGQKVLRDNGWNCSQPISKWTRRTGVILAWEGGETIAEININCRAAGWGPLGGPLTEGLAAYSSLTRFAIRNCRLTGSLPKDFDGEGAFPSLQVLSLAGNKLSGKLPPGLGSGASMNSLTSLSLANNDFSGGLPAEWAQAGYFTNLQSLNLGRNRKLTGGLPTSWGRTTASWPASISINICGTAISGPVPKEWDSCCLKLYTAVGTSRVCGPVSGSFAVDGNDAGLYACGSWSKPTPRPITTVPNCK